MATGDTTPGTPEISVVIPVLDEAARVAALLRDLRARFPGIELVVVDGGSTDGTAERAAALADRVVRAERSRARQSNAGAALARGSVLVFLHADTRLPDGADAALVAALGGTSGRAGRPDWGRFDVRIEGAHPLLPTIGRCMNLRSRLTGVATGDQAMFVTRAAFDAVGGFPELALMEDIALSKRLRARSRPACLGLRVVTSGRRWEANGALRTIGVMWLLRLGFVLGVHPDRLAAGYRRLRVR